ncbi:MAG: twin-arginine translocase TatA/TatE family subunit [Planctomycetota bacterium]
MSTISTPVLGFFGLPGHFEMIIILVVLLLLFGRRLPEVARSLGDGIREFKKGVREVTEDPPQQTNYQQPPQQQMPPPTPPAQNQSQNTAPPPASDERRVSQEPHASATTGEGGSNG